MSPETFKESVFILKDEMFRFARRFVSSKDEAEDVVQEVMTKFWQNRAQLANCANVRAYALKCVKNDCLNRLKHEDVKLKFSKLGIFETVSARSEFNNLTDEILKFIDALPEKQRLVIHLKDVEDYDTSEIAEILQMEESRF